MTGREAVESEIHYVAPVGEKHVGSNIIHWISVGYFRKYSALKCLSNAQLNLTLDIDGNF